MTRVRRAVPRRSTIGACAAKPICASSTFKTIDATGLGRVGGRTNGGRSRSLDRPELTLFFGH
ncbi:MAG TPA: hypothetical protein DCQ98_14490 [Planctomycetaceae bacterium]|nr:hypothetical protein [Planctomycetaceae bacterium]